MAKNSPDLLVALTEAQGRFVIENCDTNIAFGLQSIGTITNETNARRMVTLIEEFKSLKQAVVKAQNER